MDFELLEKCLDCCTAITWIEYEVHKDLRSESRKFASLLLEMRVYYLSNTTLVRGTTTYYVLPTVLLLGTYVVLPSAYLVLLPATCLLVDSGWCVAI